MKLKRRYVARAWLTFFGIWMLLLTGMLGSFVKSPGVKQWYSVKSALKDKRQEIDDIEAQTLLLTQTAHQLEFNNVAQEREIRKVLGYLGEKELVFEFQAL